MRWRHSYDIWCDKLLFSGRKYDATPNRICSVFDFYPPLCFSISRIYIHKLGNELLLHRTHFTSNTINNTFNQCIFFSLCLENILLGTILSPCFSLYGIPTTWSIHGFHNGFRVCIFFLIIHFCSFVCIIYSCKIYTQHEYRIAVPSKNMIHRFACVQCFCGRQMWRYKLTYCNTRILLKKTHFIFDWNYYNS